MAYKPHKITSPEIAQARLKKILSCDAARYRERAKADARNIHPDQITRIDVETVATRPSEDPFNIPYTVSIPRRRQ